MSLAAIDYVFGIIILIFAIIALTKGFVDEVFGKAAWVVGIICSIIFYKEIAVYYGSKISSAILCNILGFITIFVVVFLVIKLVGLLVGKLFEFSILKSLDHSLGFIFGLLEGFAIVNLIIFLMTVQGVVDTTGLFQDSFFYSLFTNLMKSPDFKDVVQNV